VAPELAEYRMVPKVFRVEVEAVAVAQLGPVKVVTAAGAPTA
jgi:hypothetical protein